MSKTLLDQFLSEYGTQREAAAALAVSEAYVSRLKDGSRGISPQLAVRIEEVSEGRFCKSELLWGAADNKH